MQEYDYTPQGLVFKSIYLHSDATECARDGVLRSSFLRVISVK